MDEIALAHTEGREPDLGGGPDPDAAAAWPGAPGDDETGRVAEARVDPGTVPLPALAPGAGLTKRRSLEATPAYAGGVYLGRYRGGQKKHDETVDRLIEHEKRAGRAPGGPDVERRREAGKETIEVDHRLHPIFARWRKDAANLNAYNDAAERRGYAAECINQTTVSIEALSAGTPADNADDLVDVIKMIENHPARTQVRVLVRFKTAHDYYIASFVVVDNKDRGRREAACPRLLLMNDDPNDRDDVCAMPPLPEIGSGLEGLAALLSEVLNEAATGEQHDTTAGA